ncbi:hypothetical protein CSC17_1042 [Klebsiella oxytoca]|nr:hypothetical protein CSC17_1042 [Klebsiella oxytoca]
MFVKYSADETAILPLIRDFFTRLRDCFGPEERYAIARSITQKRSGS